MNITFDVPPEYQVTSVLYNAMDVVLCLRKGKEDCQLSGKILWAIANLYNSVVKNGNPQDTSSEGTLSEFYFASPLVNNIEKKVSSSAFQILLHTFIILVNISIAKQFSIRNNYY